ncbi:MAG TPA: hypothetical protein VHS53_10400 [Mucilaginibacter sp.]|jgi:hypothetical protein|nr:hypothetical protein [Mucilaginibacter sp.]
MSGISEIKCPHCGEWTRWSGHVEETCGKCSRPLDPHRFSREAERKLTKTKKNRKADFFPIKKSDGPVTRELKGFVNAMGWIVFYSEVAFYIGVIGVIAILGFLAG